MMMMTVRIIPGAYLLMIPVICVAVIVVLLFIMFTCLSNYN